MARGCRSERGQASLEWLAVVALVASLLGLGTALAQAEFVGRRVTRGMARAICVVSAGDCWRDRDPCVVGAASTRSTWSASITILRLGDDRLALVERRSDGTYAVTLERAPKGGLGAAGGTHVSVHLAGLDVSIGGELTASLLARLGGGRTWIVGSEAEARSLLEHGGSSRPPDVTYQDRAWLGALGATLGVDALVHLPVAQGGLTFDQHWGTSTDGRTGHRTVFVDASWEAQGTALGGVLGLSEGHQGEVYAVELDASGRPLDLRITSAGPFGGSRDLPAVVQPVAGLLEARGAGDRRFEVTAHLDLTDARNLAAARGLLDAIAHKRGRAEPTQELRRLVAERGTVEARVLAEQVATGAPRGLALTAQGVSLGFERQAEQRSRQLLAATSRGLDGQWIARTDCVA